MTNISESPFANFSVYRVITVNKKRPANGGQIIFSKTTALVDTESQAIPDT